MCFTAEILLFNLCLPFINKLVILGNCGDISVFLIIVIIIIIIIFNFKNQSISFILMCVHTRERDSSPGYECV